MIKVFNLNRIRIGLLTAMSLSGPAYAEDNSKANKNNKIEVIQVTAQKRSQSINEIPMAISAFGSAQLDELGIKDTADLAAVVPGFNYSDTAFGPPVYTLRGVGFNESSATATSTVGIYVDEVAIPFPIMTKGANLDLERVEVLKGPQGTLYGRNSTAGAINYIAAKPTDNFQSGFKSTAGNFQKISAEGFVSGALTDNLNARLALRLINSAEGWQDSISRHDKLGEQDKLSTRLTLDWAISDTTNALIRGSYFKDESDSLAPQAIQYNPAKAGGVANASWPIFGPILDGSNPDLFPGNGNGIQEADWTAGRNPALDHETKNMSLKLTHEISDSMIFTSLTSYSDFDDNNSQYERGGFGGVTAGFVRDLVNLTPTSLFDSGVDYEDFLQGEYAHYSDDEYVTSDYVFQNGSITSFSQEFRVNGETENVNWILGVYFSKSDVDYNTLQDFGTSTNVNLFKHPASGQVLGFNQLRNEVNQESETWATFASADWNVTDELTVTTGLRYTNDSTDYKGCTKDVDGTAAPIWSAFFGVPIEPNSCLTVHNFPGSDARVDWVYDTLKEDSVSWRFAANYEMDRDTSLYASYSRGFKAGSFPSLAAITIDQLEPVVQERLDAYEVGFKMMLDDGSAQFNGSVFYYDYKDKQLLTKRAIPIFKTAFTLGNMDKSEVKGIEFDLFWLATDGLTISAAVGWLDTEITDGQGFNQAGESLDFEGSELPFASTVQANLTAKYEWEISVGYEMFVAMDMSYIGDFNTDFEGKGNETLQVSLLEGTPVEVNIPPQPYRYDSRFTQDSYTLVNVRVGIVNFEENWQIYAWVKNVGDEYYNNSIVKNAEMIASYAGMTRTFGVTFEYSYF